MAAFWHCCWSPSIDEVAISMDLNAETVTAGEPVWIRLHLFNGTGEAVEVGVDDEEPKELSVRVSESGGRRVGPPADYRVPMCGLWWVEIVKPGETFEGRVLLNRSFRLDEPGEYVVRARYPRPLRPGRDERLRRPAEFTLKLLVTPEDKGRLRTVAGELATTACREGAERRTAMSAARTLATIDDPVARLYLTRLLGCSDLLVRLEGVAGLQREGSPRAIAILIAAAEAADPDLVAIARGALEGIVRGPRSMELAPELVARARAAVGRERIQ
ncbi:MAG: hypothetical protein ACREKH_04885 [Candidatus Rokuibacteriota bacterium]